MKIVNLITVSILANAVSLTVFANPTEQPQSSGNTEENTSIPMSEGMMPMMRGQQGGMPMMMQDQQRNMPMVRGQQGRMPMMMHGRQGGTPMMQGRQGSMPMMRGQQGGMPMMQQRQGEMRAHMKRMESHL